MKYTPKIQELMPGDEANSPLGWFLKAWEELWPMLSEVAIAVADHGRRYKMIKEVDRL